MRSTGVGFNEGRHPKYRKEESIKSIKQVAFRFVFYGHGTGKKQVSAVVSVLNGAVQQVIGLSTRRMLIIEATVK